MTVLNSVDKAVQMLKMGAFTYLTKPCAWKSCSMTLPMPWKGGHGKKNPPAPGRPSEDLFF